MAMRKHKPLAMHLIKHRDRLTEYSVVADVQRYRIRAMLARRVLMHDVETAQSQRLLPELSSNFLRPLRIFFLLLSSLSTVFTGSQCGHLLLTIPPVLPTKMIKLLELRAHLITLVYGTGQFLLSALPFDELHD
jgi:hypothetical protein